MQMSQAAQPAAAHCSSRRYACSALLIGHGNCLQRLPLLLLLMHLPPAALVRPNRPTIGFGEAADAAGVQVRPAAAAATAAPAAAGWLPSVLLRCFEPAAAAGRMLSSARLPACLLAPATSADAMAAASPTFLPPSLQEFDLSESDLEGQQLQLK